MKVSIFVLLDPSGTQNYRRESEHSSSCGLEHRSTANCYPREWWTVIVIIDCTTIISSSSRVQLQADPV